MIPKEEMLLIFNEMEENERDELLSILKTETLTTKMFRHWCLYANTSDELYLMVQSFLLGANINNPDYVLDNWNEFITEIDNKEYNENY